MKVIVIAMIGSLLLYGLVFIHASSAAERNGVDRVHQQLIEAGLE